jgi:hypothetical protein
MQNAWLARSKFPELMKPRSISLKPNQQVEWPELDDPFGGVKPRGNSHATKDPKGPATAPAAESEPGNPGLPELPDGSEITTAPRPQPQNGNSPAHTLRSPATDSSFPVAPRPSQLTRQIPVSAGAWEDPLSGLTSAAPPSRRSPSRPGRDLGPSDPAGSLRLPTHNLAGLAASLAQGEKPNEQAAHSSQRPASFPAALPPNRPQIPSEKAATLPSAWSHPLAILRPPALPSAGENIPLASFAPSARQPAAATTEVRGSEQDISGSVQSMARKVPPPGFEQGAPPMQDRDAGKGEVDGSPASGGDFSLLTEKGAGQPMGLPETSNFTTDADLGNVHPRGSTLIPSGGPCHCYITFFGFFGVEKMKGRQG